jgi:hypothetical protein
MQAGRVAVKAVDVGANDIFVAIDRQRLLDHAEELLVFALERNLAPDVTQRAPFAD